MNSSVRERTSIGAYATVGMGAAVLSNVPDGETWVCMPAHAIDRGSAEFLSVCQRLLNPAALPGEAR